MFTNDQRQAERTGKYGTPRLQYLQELVNEFQSSTSQETKERLVANLANFSYDPYNYSFLRQLNVLELFLDCMTEPNEKLIEFGIGGICNSCVGGILEFEPYPANASIITQCGGIPLIIECLSSPVKNTRSLGIFKGKPYFGGSVHSGWIVEGDSPFKRLLDIVNYALGAIYYLCNASNKEEIMKPEVVDVINRYAVAESVSFSNLAKAILDKHLSNRN
ncbi:armadillo repeat-containing protein 7 [Cucumis melo var. makuwa]|uniref:Armadillo repeat-containing protein 7 n=1 Tax=Cucumis melo var. makuwa TaxID=1194695 RepID=A0A5D3CBH6_CUCMM|nr:armadillo repeat-containing protein 7 [Cucumis melo var. makuwa]